jgi:hypothetical protein
VEYEFGPPNEGMYVESGEFSSEEPSSRIFGRAVACSSLSVSEFARPASLKGLYSISWITGVFWPETSRRSGAEESAESNWGRSGREI